ncbi:hypothetical protein HY798_02200 [Candidatus Falkowbacteria bacterium]|nr:hypothetical protein [Candidatus Falkowbacteria bacterium]
MRRISLLLLNALILGLAPWTAFADTADPYADNVSSASNQVYQPSNAIGAPDGQKLTFFSKDANLTLDMGEGEEGTGDLLLHLELLNYGARYVVEFLNAGKLKIEFKGDIIPAMTSPITVAYTGGVPYRYVMIRSDASEQWKLDAVEAKTYNQPAAPPAPPPSEEPPPPAPTINSGDLIKLPDDGNATTTYDAAVYTIGADGKRHAFPNETTFFSWFVDYSAVKTVTAETMATYTLGANVTIKPGTHLVKITTDPKTYAVEPGGVLRWITTEQIAKDLYGADWAKKVVDVPDVFFKNYTQGEDVTASNVGTFNKNPSVTYPF